MRLVAFILLMAWSLIALADQLPEPNTGPYQVGNNGYQSYTTQQMYDIVTGAALKREDVKLLSKNAEDWGMARFRYLGLNEKYLTPIVIVLSPLVVHKASTRGFNMRYMLRTNMTIRPDVEYDFLSQETNTTLSLVWGF